MAVKIKKTDTNVKLMEARAEQPIVRSGGEHRPLEYPHLYQIQAGDWRISYAVEHNRLAILVLEVLTPEGTVRKDAAADTVTRKMKVKLLDWPEGSPSRDLPPEQLGKKLKIKFLDLADDLAAEARPAPPAGGSIKFPDAVAARAEKRKISFVDSSAKPAGRDAGNQGTSSTGGAAEGKVTPLDSPTM